MNVIIPSNTVDGSGIETAAGAARAAGATADSMRYENAAGVISELSPRRTNA
jgi:hypothetical protein